MKATFTAFLNTASHHHSLFNQPEHAYRMFKSLPCKDGVHSLSIQASYGHYCEPSITLPAERFGDYTAWEVAIVGKDGLVTPDENDPVFGPFADLWGGDTVAGYVPTERVQALYEVACLGIRNEVSKPEPKPEPVKTVTINGKEFSIRHVIAISRLFTADVVGEILSGVRQLDDCELAMVEDEVRQLD